MKTIVIIGKRNVGKSSLFNLLANKFEAISLDYEGYTRDCNYKCTKIFSRFYEVIDTPGIGYFDDNLDVLAIRKTWEVIKQSNIILFLIEFEDIYNKLFLNVVNMLPNNVGSIIYVLNKIDIVSHVDINHFLADFSYFNPILVSIKHKTGINELLKRIDSIYTVNDSVLTKKKRAFKISIIGKQNVGKSLLSNRLSSINTSIVYDYPGTTRDNLEVYVMRNYSTYAIVDTPGIKKKKNIFNQVNNMSVQKAFFAMRESDMCIIVLDVNDIFNKQNLVIIKNAFKLCKFNLVVLNKSDRINKKDLILVNKKLSEWLSFSIDFNYQFISSKYSFNLNQLFYRIDYLKMMQQKTSLLDVLGSIKCIINNKLDILDKGLIIRKMYIKNFNNYTIRVILKNKNVPDSYKKYLCTLIVKHINLKMFSFKFDFK